jgi:uncharacterized protein (DUF924 family)
MTIGFEDALEFWFGPDVKDDAAIERQSMSWFIQDAGFDEEIARRFGELPDRAIAGELDAWRSAPRSTLALVLAVDQFPRNLYRGSARAFRYDALGLEVAEAAIEAGFDRALHPIEASFFYLPLEHAEDLETQERCVAVFDGLGQRCSGSLRDRVALSCEFAKRHREVIRSFGRFPHRNAVLGRESTREELSYLERGGETFGGGAG